MDTLMLEDLIGSWEASLKPLLKPSEFPAPTFDYDKMKIENYNNLQAKIGKMDLSDFVTVSQTSSDTEEEWEKLKNLNPFSTWSGDGFDPEAYKITASDR